MLRAPLTGRDTIGILKNTRNHIPQRDSVVTIREDFQQGMESVS